MMLTRRKLALLAKWAQRDFPGLSLEEAIDRYLVKMADQPYGKYVLRRRVNEDGQNIFWIERVH